MLLFGLLLLFWSLFELFDDEKPLNASMVALIGNELDDDEIIDDGDDDDDDDDEVEDGEIEIILSSDRILFLIAAFDNGN